MNKMTDEQLAAHKANIERIEKLIAWKQQLNETDSKTYRDHLLLQWQEAKDQIDYWKAVEMERRKACVGFAFDPEKKEGTERVELGGGYEAKAVKKLNYNFVKRADGKRVDVLAIEKALSAIEARTPAGSLIAERLVKWSPELSISEYRKLEDDDKAAIDAVIVTTDAAPTLEIVEPKTKGKK